MDTFKTLWEDFNDRFRSPFVVSFILSALAWNWELLYSVLNFDAGVNREAKVQFIHEYINSHHCALSIYPLLTSVGAAIFFYVFKSIFLAMESIYQNRLRIKALTIVGLTDMVPKEDLLERIKEISLLKSELDTNVLQNSKSQLRISELQQVINANNYNAREAEDIKQRFDKLSDDYNALKAAENRFEKPKSLDLIFSGLWINEYQVNNPSGLHRNIEPFVVKEDNYYVNSQIDYVIRNIEFDSKQGVLQFTKSKFKFPDKKNTMKLFMVSKDYWIGYEITHENSFAYIRMYPENNRPKDMYYYFPKVNESTTIEDLKSFWVKITSKMQG